jgi:LytS/YehU family sensor histidine kinase
VPLSTEMDFLESYVFLLDIRFKDKLKVNIMVPEEKLNMKIPPLTIQLLIENAIKHNIFSIKSPLIIDVLVDKNNFLNVINNYQKRERQIESTGLGLQNITDRIGYFTRERPYFVLRTISLSQEYLIMIYEEMSTVCNKYWIPVF